MYGTIIVSDLHIGRDDCNIEGFFEFIKEHWSKVLVLNGDIFDQFALWKDGGNLYREKHSKFVKEIISMLKKRKTKIIYLVGNHDYLAFLLVPFSFLIGVVVKKRLTMKKNVIIEHGDWIKCYLTIKRFFDPSIKVSKDFFENCLTFARLKKKYLVVGHSHNPKENGWVCDEGDWVKHNTFLILEDWI